MHAKQWWMAVAGASMMALALPLSAAPEDDAVTTSVYLGQANAAASLEHWDEAAGFFEKAFGTVPADAVSEEAFSWLTEAGDDWLKAGDRAHAANAYRHAAAVAGITGRLRAMAATESKLSDVLTDIDQREEAGKTYHRFEAIGKLLKAGPAYPKDGPGWIKCEDLGYELRLSRLKGDDTGRRLLLPDVPPNGGGQEYLIQEPDGKRTKVSQRVAIDWVKAEAAAAR